MKHLFTYENARDLIAFASLAIFLFALAGWLPEIERFIR